MAHKRLSALVTSTTPSEEPLSTPTMTPDSADSRARLRKPLPNNHHARSASAHIYTPTSAPPRFPGSGSGPSSPLQPPPAILADSYTHSRSSSQDSRSRPATPANYSRPGTPATYSRPGTPATYSRPGTPSSPMGDKEKKKSGWFGKSKKDGHEDLPTAWIAGHPQKPAWDTAALLNGRPVSELWDDTDGNCLVYLFPRSSGRGPSFKIDSAVFASSPVLTRLAFGDLPTSNTGDRRHPPLDVRVQNMSLNTPPASPRLKHTTPNSPSSSSLSSRGRLSNISEPTADTHLYLPIKFQQQYNTQTITQTPPRSKDGNDDAAMQDMQTLVDIRNFFAFLSGQSLVATEKKHSFFQVFMIISGILKSYEFSNLDGSTFGEVASSSFDGYVEELGLADVRGSREKTIEGIVLGERMKSVLLYNEAFAHGAGKHEELTNLKSPKFGLMSSVTDNRLIRAAMDLDKRVASAQLVMTDFDIPTLFTGIMASKTSVERKEGVRFEGWKEAYLGFRKNYMSILKHRYGDWPPKAKSKKNDLETSGLSRLVLRDVYQDMSSLYDLLVDRHALTTRTVDGIDLGGERQEPTIRALRAVLSEYDRSSPPVKPPIPFDLPILPNLRSARPEFGQDKKKDIKAIQKKLRDDEISQVLLHSWNKDALAKPSPFLQSFWEMEKRAAHSCTISETIDLRIGQWIFMYVVLQGLPMLACDAPGLKWTKGVEYFLCEPPRKGVPWANPNAPTPTGGAAISSAGPVGRTWFSVGEGANVVSLPSDLVEHGIEGIYRRSHCWVMAEKWTVENPILNSALHEQEGGNAVAEEAAANHGAQQFTQRPTSRPREQGYRDFSAPADFAAPSPNLLKPDSRPGSRASKRFSSLGMGLEALPLPVGVTPDGSTPTGYRSPDGGTPQERPKSTHAVDASKTFDAILASVDQGSKKGKRK